MVTIRPIHTPAEFRAFTKFRIDLYKGNACDTPPLYSDELETLCDGRNPALDIYKHQAYVAERDGRIVGRVVAIINHVGNAKEGREYVRFGFIDFIDDDGVVDALIGAVEEFGRRNGMTDIHGPLGFTDFDPEGMLVEGFDQLGTMIGIYNHDYYPRQMERLGFVKGADWVEFKIPIPEAIPEKHLRIAALAREKYNLRALRFRRVSEIIRGGWGVRLFELLNITYADLYGYSNLNERLIDYYIKKYVPLLRRELVTLIVNDRDELVCFGVALPSLSRALQKARGRLFPVGIFHLLRALNGKAEVCDLMLVAVHPDYRNMGVAAMLFTELIPQFHKLGTRLAESNPELENNLKVQLLWKDLNPQMHKRRRVWEKSIRNKN
jgi:GNAT superfamily N-acetyltransferase